MTNDSKSLNKHVAELLRDPRFHAAVRRASGFGNDAAELLEFEVPTADQMLAHSLTHHRDAAIALSQYFNISIQQFNCFRQIARAVFDAPPNELKVLDFACGYGRLLRFLAAWLPDNNVRGAEIQPEALETNKRLFRIPGYLSAADPGGFSIDRRFDMIWVASLFSHLPDRLFRAWLGKLQSLLTPGGVLCFSVRDASQFSAAIPDQGFVYRPESERIPIDSSVYGTAWAGEDYVRRAIETGVAAPVDYVRIPRALAMEQDLYLLYGKGSRMPVRPDRFSRGPWGWVDRITRKSDGRIRIQGWAGSLDRNRIEAVEARMNGHTIRTAPDIPRPDVAEVLDNPALARSGFDIDAALPDSGFVEIGAICQNQQRALLYAGPIDTSGAISNE